VDQADQAHKSLAHQEDQAVQADQEVQADQADPEDQVNDSCLAFQECD
jgi:hypothetical protein